MTILNQSQLPDIVPIQLNEQEIVESVGQSVPSKYKAKAKEHFLTGLLITLTIPLCYLILPIYSAFLPIIGVIIGCSFFYRWAYLYYEPAHQAFYITTNMRVIYLHLELMKDLEFESVYYKDLHEISVNGQDVIIDTNEMVTYADSSQTRKYLRTIHFVEDSAHFVRMVNQKLTKYRLPS